METFWIGLFSIAVCYLVVGAGTAISIIEDNDKYKGKSYHDVKLDSPDNKFVFIFTTAFMWLPNLLSKE